MTKARPEKTYHGKFMELSRLRSLAFTDDPWLVEKLLVPGGKLLLTGPQKKGKSFLALQLANCIGTGGEFIGYKIPRPGYVVYIQYEVTVRRMQERVIDQWRYFGDPKIEPVIMSKPPRDKTVVDLVDQVVMERGKVPDLVIFDPLVNTHDLDENNSKDMKAHMDRFDDIIDRHGCAVMLVHHHRKSGEGGKSLFGADQARGSSHLTAWPNTIITLNKSGKGVRLNFEVRDAEEQGPINLILNQDFKVFETVGRRPNLDRAFFEELLVENPGISKRDLVSMVTEMTDYSDKTVYRRLGETGIDVFEM